MSARNDLSKANSFSELIDSRTKAIGAYHRHSMWSWLKSRTSRLDPRGGTKEKAALGVVGLTGRGLSPGKFVESAVRAGTTVGQHTAKIAPVPLASTVITLGTFAYGKYRGRGTNDAMTNKYGDRSRNENDFVEMTNEECCRFVGWFAEDGLKQMTDAMRKLVSAQRNFEKTRKKYNNSSNSANYLDLVDKYVYLKYRITRADFYTDMLSAVAKKYKEILHKDMPDDSELLEIHKALLSEFREKKRKLSS